MSNRVFVGRPPSIKLKSPLKNKTKTESVETSLNANALEKVKELEAKVAHLTKLLRDGRKHAGLELQAATTKKRLAKAREMCKINTLMNVKSSHPSDKQTDSDAKSKSKTNSNKFTSKEYGNYYSMRSHILHMEIHQQDIIEAKGLQNFLTEYQNKLAKCFQFEQNRTVQDLFATNRINKLSEKRIENTEAVKAADSDESMSEVFMEKDLDTLVSTNSSGSSHLATDVPSETNFVSQFLLDKVLEFLRAAASSVGDFQSPTFPFDIRHFASESVSDTRLEQLMAVRSRSSPSVASMKGDFPSKKSAEFRGKCSDIIPIKNARAMTDIKKLIS